MGTVLRVLHELQVLTPQKNQKIEINLFSPGELPSCTRLLTREQTTRLLNSPRLTRADEELLTAEVKGISWTRDKATLNATVSKEVLA